MRDNIGRDKRENHRQSLIKDKDTYLEVDQLYGIVIQNLTTKFQTLVSQLFPKKALNSGDSILGT